MKKAFSYTSERLFMGFITGEFKNSRIKSLANKTGMSTMSVSRALEDLVSRGILSEPHHPNEIFGWCFSFQDFVYVVSV